MLAALQFLFNHKLLKATEGLEIIAGAQKHLKAKTNQTKIVPVKGSPQHLKLHLWRDCRKEMGIEKGVDGKGKQGERQKGKRGDGRGRVDIPKLRMHWYHWTKSYNADKLCVNNQRNTENWKRHLDCENIHWMVDSRMEIPADHRRCTVYVQLACYLVQSRHVYNTTTTLERLLCTLWPIKKCHFILHYNLHVSWRVFTGFLYQWKQDWMF